MQVDADRRHEKSARPAQRRGEHRQTRTAFFDPSTAQRRGCPEKDNGDAEDPAELGQLPIVRRMCGDADQLGHRQIENAERVDLPDAQMDT